MGNTRNTGYLQNIVLYDANDNITLPARLAVTGTVSVNNTTPYDTTQFSLDINGGLIVKNINKTAQFVLINSNPASGGNNAFIVHTVGGTSAASYADIQGYYGTSIAGSTVIRLNPQGGNVLIGSLVGTGTRMVVADSTGVLSTQAVQTLSDLSGVPTTRTITINGTSYDLSANRSWTINSMVYPAVGIAVSTGTAWTTSITDNSANWNTAYGWGNHASAGYATTTYVGTQIANLIASAPATLDTLNELAAALGNDPSFATTVTTSIGTKVPQTRTITINGTSYDLSANRSWTINSMVYPNAGIALSNGTGWGASIIDNSANWNTAYGWGNHTSAGYLPSSIAATTYVSLTGSYANPSWITSLAYSKITGVPAFLTSYTETDPYRVTAVAVSGTSTKTITITRADASTVTTTWTDIDTDTNTYVTSAAFSGGTLTLTRNDSGTVSVSLDGRYYLASNPSGYLTGITSSQVTTALGYTPYNSTNPNGYISSYTETSTLANVTARGSSTTAGITVNGDMNATGIVYSRANQTTAYTSAALWTQSFGSTLTGIAFHVSGVVGRMLHMNASTTDANLYWNGTALVYNSGTWGINITGSAGSVAWTNVTSRPTALSQFTNDLGNYGGWITSYTETSTLANVTSRGATTTAAITTGGLTVNTGGSGTWGQFVVNSTSLWGDGATLYTTIGAGGAAGVMLFNPHVVWNSGSSCAGIRIGRSGGTSSGKYYEIGTGASDNFFIAKEGLASGTQLNINSSGNATFSGTITASNFSGSSSGTNTGDQTNISGNAGTVTNGVYTTGDQTIGGVKTFGKRTYFGSSSGWDDGSLNGENGNITNVHFQGHADFWIGAGNGTWYTTATAGEHDLIINTMQAQTSYDRGISFTATTSGGSGYRLGKWYAKTSAATSYLAINGSLTVSGTLNLPGNALISVNAEPDTWGARLRTTTSTTNLGAALKNIIWTGGGTSEGFAVTGVGTGGAAFEVRNDGIVWAKSTIYSAGNAVITSGNIGSQSVSYASSAGSSHGIGYDGNAISGMGPISTWDSRPGVGMAGFGISWHTGVSISGYPGYGGVRLYSAGYPTHASSVLRLEASTAVYTYGGLYSDGNAVIHAGNISSQPVVTIQDAAPSGSAGRLWWESDTGKLKVYYGSAWVDASPIPDSSLFFAKAGGSITGDVSIGQTLNVVGNTLVQGTIYSFGDVIAYSSSDARLKDNITVIDSPLEKVSKINGVSFNWNDKQTAYEVGKKDIGVIAQEVEEVLPELVTTRDNGYKAVRYEKIVALLIEAIKEQQVQINSLTDKLNNL